MASYILHIDDNGYSFQAHKQPEFKIDKKKDWVLWGYSEFKNDIEDQKWNNLQPEYYKWLYDSSSKHRAILNTKIDFICGKGLGLDDTGLNQQEVIEGRAFLKKLTKERFVKRITKDLTRLNGFAYEVIPDKKGTKVFPHPIPFGKLRRSKPEYDEQGRLLPTVYYYTDDWTTKRPEDNPDFTLFFQYEGEFSGNKRYIVYHSEDEENLYPLPEYTAAVPYIAADFEVGNFVYNNTKAGFNGSYLINFYNGEPDEQQKAEIVEQVKQTFQGSDNAGKPMVSFNEEGGAGVEVTPLSSNGQDDRYVNLNNQIREEIYSGHTMNPIIAGLKGEAGFANNADELRVVTEQFQSRYVQPRQLIIEEHINTLMIFNEIKGEAFIKDLEPQQAEVSEAELGQILTINERRERAGFEPMDDGDVITQSIETKIFKGGKSDDDTILNYFENTGISDDELEVIATKEIQAFSIDEAEKQAAEFKFITIIEQTILNLIKGGKSLEEVAEVTKLPLEQVTEISDNLTNQGLLDEDGNPTEEAENELKEEEIITVYKYVKRRDASGGDIIDGTRDFCRRLVLQSQTRSWTIDQIRMLNNGQGLDVFRSRGGWYRLPNGVSRPSCRHVWEARLVKKKDNGNSN